MTTPVPLRIYLAGPLFTEAERMWLALAKSRIEGLGRAAGQELVVVWPWELTPADQIRAWGDRAKFEIAARCREALFASDLLVALLDGPDVDSGTAWEIGAFSGARPGAVILGVRTDLRRAGETDTSLVNAMIEASCTRIVGSLDELLVVFLLERGPT